MAYVAAFLFLVSSILILINYLQNLYDVRRKVKITSFRMVRNADGTKDQEKIVKEYTQAPGPTPIPILGNLATIGQYGKLIFFYNFIFQLKGDEVFR